MTEKIVLISGGGLLTIYLFYFLLTGVFSFAIRPRKKTRPTSTFRLKKEWEDKRKKDVPDQVKIIADPADALSVRIALVRAAQESLDVTYFSLSNTACGMAFLSEVLRAADRGVKVRILLDAKMKTLLYGIMRVLAQHPQIKIARYNPINILKPWTWNEAMHDKFMIVDQKYALLGGRNIETSYFGLAEPPLSNKYDWDVLMKRDQGSAAGTSIVDAITAYNNLLWEKKSTKKARRRLTKSRIVDDIHTIAAEFAAEHPEFYQENISDFAQDMIRPNRIMLLHNPLTSWRKDPWVIQDLAILASQAEKSLFIQTPYATATPPLLKVLKETAARIDVYYLTNSYASAKNAPAYPNYYYQRKKFLKTGIKIYEFQNEDSIHGKSVVLDKSISVVGSFNLDSRSIYLDTETMLVIDCPEFTRIFSENHRKIIENSLKLGQDNEYILSDTTEEVPVPRGKKLTYFLFYVLLRPFQFFI
ncbi:MAG: phosphatidylserine/phosphatidylglycerophosphate/cardiolipin synthase family protein [Fastidiosipila sp.]|nr:phosphatidylserine/phosphatidylglycerophosphate/cardiolipin synthase family protein [Fastidiosipila sp.]